MCNAMRGLPHERLLQYGELERTADGMLVQEVECQCLQSMTLKDVVSHYRRTRTGHREGYVWNVLSQIADGLHFLHMHHLPHANLTPNTIHLDGGVVKLSGIGNERSLKLNGCQPDITLEEMNYMSPERLQGDVELAGDLWSVGCVIYELVTSQQPFGLRSQSTPLLASYVP